MLPVCVFSATIKMQYYIASETYHNLLQFDTKFVEALICIFWSRYLLLLDCIAFLSFLALGKPCHGRHALPRLFLSFCQATGTHVERIWKGYYVASPQIWPISWPEYVLIENTALYHM